MSQYNSEEYFEIPNPLYDVVFKYLMDDEETAKDVLEILTGYKILQLHLDETEHAYAWNTEKKQLESEEENESDDTSEDEFDERKVSLFHLDFTATIEIAPQQTEIVMIEIQKANRMADIFRFKRYIAKNFQRKQERENVNPKTGKIRKINYPIKLIPIFILNFEIETEHQDLVIRSRQLDEALFFDKSYENEILPSI